GAGALLVDIRLFDVYRSSDMVDERGLAYRIRIQAADRTLAEEDVARVREACIAAASKLSVTLRT
ncbi:MAG: hypothetical protein ACKOA6_03965, partial [Actinomycetota bacterium]